MKTYFKEKGKLSHLLGLMINKDDPKFVSWDEENSEIMSWLWNSMQPVEYNVFIVYYLSLLI